LVFDAIYTPKLTRLLREAQESGATIVYGTEMFINQAFVQFEKFSGLPGKMKQQHHQTSNSLHQNLDIYISPFFSLSSHHLSLNFSCSTKATD
jgi:shikimate 5-dehydrogenase